MYISWMDNKIIDFLKNEPNCEPIFFFVVPAIILIGLLSSLRPPRKGCFDRRYGSSKTCFGVTKRGNKEDPPPPQIRLEHLSTMMKNPKPEGTEPLTENVTDNKVIPSKGTRAVFTEYNVEIGILDYIPS